MLSPPQPQSHPYRDPALDGLRGVAVLLVFLFHYGGGLRAHHPLIRAFGYLTQAGWLGVEIFFALSGFLITGILLDGQRLPGEFKSFYARRALRILPLYFAALMACALAALAAGATAAQLKPLLIYAGFLQNLPPFVHLVLQTPPPLPVFHLWSLAVEEQFYLLWPCLVLLARTPRNVFLLGIGIFASSAAFRWVLFMPQLVSPHTAESFATLLPTRMGALALGSTLAAFLRYKPGTDLRRPAGWLALAALALVIATGSATHSFQLRSGPSYRLLLPSAELFSLALVALCLEQGPVRSAISTTPLRMLGRISYGVYVLHILLEPIIDGLSDLLTHAASGFPYQTTRLCVALPLTVAMATLSYLLLERPFLRLKRRFPRTSSLSPVSPHDSALVIEGARTPG